MASRFNQIPPHEIALEVAGLAYFGWTEVEVERAIDQLAGSFNLTVAAKERTEAEDWQVSEGDPCRITLGGRVLISGYIDSIDRAIDANDRSVQIRGRDKTADLVDCSAIHSPGSWTNQKLEKIAGELVEPFGIALDVAGDTGAPFKRFALQQGETVFSALERMARYRGLVCWSRGDGRVRIGAPDTGERSGALVEGTNIESASGQSDASERFSQYVVKGQSSGDDQRSGKAAAQVKASATDSGVARYRPMLIVGEEQSDKASLQKRADWEATVRRGRGESSTVTVPGWFDLDGNPWSHGNRARCAIPGIRLEGDLLIERVRFRRDAQSGTTTELDLVLPEAWAQLAEKEPAQ